MAHSEEVAAPDAGAQAAVLPASIPVRVMTPQRMVYQGEAKRIVVKGAGGMMEILPGHEAVMSPLDIGVAKFTPAGADHDGEADIPVAVHGGFLDMDGHEAVILADAAELSSDIDPTRADEARRRAEERLEKLTQQGAGTAGLDIDRARLALMRALTRQRLGEGSAHPLTAAFEE